MERALLPAAFDPDFRCNSVTVPQFKAIYACNKPGNLEGYRKREKPGQVNSCPVQY